jgi:hypothetical protein
MPKAEFVAQLKQMGYEVQELDGNRVAFSYLIPGGRFTGQTIRLGFDVPGDFPANPPSGPHVSPRLLPLQQGGTHPNGGIHESPFGSEWQYWSRPIQHWANTKRTVRDVMAHVNRLFDTT